MKKIYEEPEMIVRNYVLPPNEDVFTTSTGEIDPDDKDPWGQNTQNYFE